MRLGTDLAAAGARTRNPSRMMRGVDVPKPSLHQLESEQVLPGDAMSILLRVQEPYRNCSGGVVYKWGPACRSNGQVRSGEFEINMADVFHWKLKGLRNWLTSKI